MESNKTSSSTPCRAVIFDMDGVLLDSEPFWQIAESEAFATVGLRLSTDDLAQTIGLRIEEVAAFWFRRSPWQGPTTQQIANRVVERVRTLIQERGEMLPGVQHTIKHLHDLGIPMTVASSSSRILIATVVERFGLGIFFPSVATADDETHGKPHPAVFLTAASNLGVEPPDCLVIEDSLNGVLAAKAAQMQCLAIPDPRQKGDPRFVLADRVVDSLEDLDPAFWRHWIQHA